MAELTRVNLQQEFAPMGVRSNPLPTYAKLRALGPVLRSPILYGEGYLLTRYEEVASVLRDPRFANDRRNIPGGTSMDKWWMPTILRMLVSSMVLKDPPDHRRLRTLVQKAFTPAMVDKMNGRLEQIAEELLDAAARKPVVDLMEDFALPLPLTVISEMLGVPPADRLAFRKLIAKVLDPAAMSPLLFLRNYPNMLQLNRFLRKLVKLRREQPGEDLVTALVQAEEGGDRLGEDELISMVFLLLFAGHETTVNLIGNGMLALVQNPEQLQKLRDQPELIDSAIEEMLRFTNPVGQVAPRFAKEDVELAGVRIPQGSTVTLLIASANLDERMFPNADRMDITRSPNRHLSFGYGVHFCLGAPLARLEARVAIPALLRRFPRIELAVSAEKLRWRPNLGLRGLEALPLAVTPASAVAGRSAA